jgi:hypothetical protein
LVICILSLSFGLGRQKKEEEKEKKERKVIYIGKEDRQLPLLMDDMLIFVENPKELPDKNSKQQTTKTVTNERLQQG